MEITRTRIYQNHHSLFLERIISLDDGQKMKIDICRNAYDHQSYARVMLWTTEAGWKILFIEQIENLEIQHHSYTTRGDEWKSVIEMDAIELADQAFDVLGIGVKR